MGYLDTLGYTDKHLWVRVEGDLVRVGVTHVGAGATGDIVFVELPPPGTRVQAGGPMGSVESVKSVFDLASPVDGVVVRINDPVIEHPAYVTSEPFGFGWLTLIRFDSPPAGLLGRATYMALPRPPGPGGDAPADG
ncbi:glycine cleavage system protein H [Microbacterium sp.]|uniref:glycine cleavage system protein H n=1 Tax=Microbacterium sp. TaxID=51671 RepID=UPI003C72A2C6